MASGYQITCANKNQNGTIVRIGGVGWSYSQQEAIRKILMKQLSMYIVVGNETFTIAVRGEGNDTYLVLEPGEKPLDNIDELKSC